MRYASMQFPSITSTALDLVENCYTDSVPIVRRLFFHNAEFDTGSNAFALGSVILTREYCGETAEFSSSVGLEYARAIRVLAPHVMNITPVNGHDRGHANSEQDVLCAPARLGRIAWSVADGTPLVPVDWSGDFVGPGTRTSAGYRQGRYFTNAGLIADETTVCIAIGLMHSGGRCRNLVVPLAAEANAEPFEILRTALEFVGIALRLVRS